MSVEKAKVLDSWAMVAFFENESSAGKVEKIILEAHKSQTPLLMSVINVGELWYSTVRGHSRAEADRAVQELKNLGIEWVDAGWELTYQAALFKSRGRISYADCFAAALTKLKKGELVTGDKEFRQVEDEVKIIWV